MCYTSHHSVQNPLAECIGGGCIGRPQRPACSKCATNLMGKKGVQLGEGQFEGHLLQELCSCQTVSHLPVCHCKYFQIPKYRSTWLVESVFV